LETWKQELNAWLKKWISSLSLIVKRDLVLYQANPEPNLKEHVKIICIPNEKKEEPPKENAYEKEEVEQVIAQKKEEEKERNMRIDKGKQVMERKDDNAKEEKVVTIIERGESLNTKEEKKNKESI